MPNDLSKRLRDAFHWVPPGNERGELALAAADLIDAQAAEIERLRKMVQTVSGLQAPNPEWPSYLTNPEPE